MQFCLFPAAAPEVHCNPHSKRLTCLGIGQGHLSKSPAAGLILKGAVLPKETCKARKALLSLLSQAFCTIRPRSKGRRQHRGLLPTAVNVKPFGHLTIKLIVLSKPSSTHRSAHVTYKGTSRHHTQSAAQGTKSGLSLWPG